VRAMATKGGKMRTIHVCSECGEGYAQWFGWCQACGAGNTLTKMFVPKDGADDGRAGAGGGPGLRASQHLNGAPRGGRGAGQGSGAAGR